MSVHIDARWFGNHGIGRFACEINARIGMPSADLPCKPTHPLDALLVSRWMLANPTQCLFSPGYNSPIIGLGRFALVVHDLNHIDVPHNSGYLKRLYYRLVMRRACRRAAAVMTVSGFTASRIAAWSGIPREKIHVVGNGVSEVFVATGPRPALVGPYFFVVGNRKGHKNEKRVVEALNESVCDDAMLLFSGEPSLELTAVVEACGLCDRVRFLGRLKDEDLAKYYRGAVAVVFPSLYEGFGLPVIESMACGTPVITSNTTSLPEVAGEAAILVNPLSVAEIGSAINRLYNDPDLRATMSANGLRQAAKFSWAEVADRVRDALATLPDSPYAIQENWRSGDQVSRGSSRLK